MATKSDLLTVIEAAYDLDAVVDGWLDGLTKAAGPFVDQGKGVYGALVDASDPAALRLGTIHAYRAQPGMVRAFEMAPDTADARRVEKLYRSGKPFVSALGQVGARNWRRIATIGPGGVADCCAVCAIDSAGRGCVIMAPSATPVPAGARPQRVWGRVTAHLVSMFRLRAGLARQDATSRADGEAVLTPDGKIVHAAGAAKERPARESLRDAALASERARGRMRRSAPDDAIEMWRAMVEGRWSIVDRFERDGRRFLIAHENEPAPGGPRALTRREQHVVTLVAMGHSNKLVGYELGLSTEAVGRYLGAAMRKLGFASRTELARMLRASWMSPPTGRRGASSTTK